MDAIKITLYEILGYIIPGIVPTLTINCVFAVMNGGSTQIDNSSLSLGLILISAYFFGHLCQATSNLFSSHMEMRVLTKERMKLNQFIRAHNIDPNIAKNDAIRIATNIASTAKYSQPKIETYLEREGFYRGSMVAFFFTFTFMCISIWLRTFSISLGKFTFTFNTNTKVLFICLSLCIVIAFAFRYMRFINYRICATLDAVRKKID